MDITKMFKRIGLIYKLSKKYNFQFKPLLSGDSGWYESNASTGKKKIAVSIFSKNFEAIFFHEIGHLVANRSLGFEQKYLKADENWLHYNNRQGQVMLIEEATASKFANRVTKGKNRQYLKDCFHTYTSEFSKHITSKYPEMLDEFISTVVVCEHKLNGGK